MHFSFVRKPMLTFDISLKGVMFSEVPGLVSELKRRLVDVISAEAVEPARVWVDLATPFSNLVTRKQGGKAIIHHQNVRYRIFHMFRKVEAARALVRRVATYNATAPEAALQGSISSKVTATQTAFEVASEALQIFGGNGMTREYPMEKLLRDARAMLIADGCNEVLALKGGSLLVNPELL